MKRIITGLLMFLGCNTLMAQTPIQLVVHVMDDDPSGNHLVNPADVTAKVQNMIDFYSKETGLKFELAKTDLNGNPMLIPGITYQNASTNYEYRTSGVAFYKEEGFEGFFNSLPGIGDGLSWNEIMNFNNARWPDKEFLNIYIVNKFNPGFCIPFCDVIGGFSSFPTIYGEPNLQGIVIAASQIIDPSSFTLIHELGHFFGLYHPFHNIGGNTSNKCPVNNNCKTQGDKICDTDPVTVSSSRRIGINPCTQAPYNDNTECNIMGYTKCGTKITKDQITLIKSNQKQDPLLRSLSHLPPLPNPIALGKALNKSEKQIRSVISIDPNEKVGITKNNAANHVNGTSPFNYKIYFENKNTATAPAQEVVIRDTLDKSKFDLSTFHLQDFGYSGSTKTYIPSSLTEYFFVDTLRRSGKPNMLVKTDAKLDTVKGILIWRFLSLDQQTNELVADPLDGFLPPNSTSPQGEGHVSYSLAPKISLPHGTVIQNKAAIYFDNNLPIVTNEFLNTIDKVKPASRVFSLPVKSYDNRFIVKWSGIDADAGLRAYDVYYSVNDGPFQLWQYDISGDSSVFTGQYDSTYRFYSISKDFAGNIEEMKSMADASTTIQQEVLPLQLTEIEAKLVLNNSEITWKTRSEANTSHFDLERSIDGLSFNRITKIQAAGNSNRLLAYDYTDRNIVALNKDKVYYRLKMVDKDGLFSYSNIVVIDLPISQLLVNLAPNPFGNSLRIVISSPKQQICRVEISDPIGRRVLTDSKNIVSGSNILHYNSDAWKPGIYIVKITTSVGSTQTFKVLKK